MLISTASTADAGAASTADAGADAAVAAGDDVTDVCLSVPGLDTRSEPCQRFFRDGLTTSFTKILTDDAVSGWKFEIHVSQGAGDTRCLPAPLRASSRAPGPSLSVS